MERDGDVSKYKTSSKNIGAKYEKLCHDEATCSKQCIIEGADKECEGTYRAKTKSSELALQFVTEGPYTTNVGSRLYMMQDENSYKIFHLKNREFTFTVDEEEAPESR